MGFGERSFCERLDGARWRFDGGGRYCSRVWLLKEDMGTTKLWHQRLGHISHRGLQELEKQGVLGNYKLTDLPFCEHCVFGKATRVKFAKAVHETQN